MKYRRSSVAFMSLAVLLIAPVAEAKPKKAAAAQKEVLWDWWHVYSGGESPKREIIYIDWLSIKKEVDHSAVLSGNFDPRKQPPSFMEADGVTVFPDAALTFIFSAVFRQIMRAQQ